MNNITTLPTTQLLNDVQEYSVGAFIQITADRFLERKDCSGEYALRHAVDCLEHVRHDGQPLTRAVAVEYADIDMR